jgi:hypothetical protein
MKKSIVLVAMMLVASAAATGCLQLQRYDNIPRKTNFLLIFFCPYELQPMDSPAKMAFHLFCLKRKQYVWRFENFSVYLQR